MPGHREGDFIKGAGNKSSVGVLAGFSHKLNSIAAPMRQSLTHDQSKESSRHQDPAERSGVAVYFCDPHGPWQRGACENTNGLLRKYLARMLAPTHPPSASTH